MGAFLIDGWSSGRARFSRDCFRTRVLTSFLMDLSAELDEAKTADKNVITTKMFMIGFIVLRLTPRDVSFLWIIV